MKGNKHTLAGIEKLRKSILADGRVDWDETEELLDALRPLAIREGFIVEDFENLLRKCRADGKITEEESSALASQLTLLCRIFARRRRRKVLIAAVCGVLLAVLVLFLIDIIHVFFS